MRLSKQARPFCFEPKGVQISFLLHTNFQAINIPIKAHQRGRV